MSPSSYKLVKLSIAEVSKLIAKINSNSVNFVYTSHARLRMRQRNVNDLDITNVLLSTKKIIREGELENGSFRYSIETKMFTVVISFDDLGTRIIIVSVWRKD